MIRVCSIILRYRKDFYFILEAELGRIPASERAKRKKKEEIATWIQEAAVAKKAQMCPCGE